VTDAPATSTHRIRRARLAFIAIAVAIVVADQIVKAWVDPAFPLASVRAAGGGFAEPTPLLGDFVRIAKTYNEGGLFGLLGGAAPLFALASLVVIGGIVVYGLRTVGRTSPLLTLTLGLLLGGAVGNLVDRLRFGHVIDFVDMGIGAWRWYTFNVADAAISTAIVGLIVIGVVGDRPLRSFLRRPSQRAAVGPTGGPP
jgi:signal peptidase II